MSFVITSHMLVLMVHAGESQCVSVYSFPQGLCSSVPFTGFDLGFAEVGLNSIMSVCSCLGINAIPGGQTFFSTFLAWPVKEECF